MATTEHDDGWYLFDYGMVISAAPAAGDWDRLHDATGQPAGLRLDAPGSTYWAHRHAFDAGALDSRGYWSAVLDRGVDADEAERLDRLDARLWSTINPDTAAVLQALRAWGAQLALLSNMPVRMSELFTAEAGWTAWFDRLFFSGPLGMGKPETRVYEHVLAELGVPAPAVVFVDDKDENIAAARALGMRTVHHVPGIDLGAELSV